MNTIYPSDPDFGRRLTKSPSLVAQEWEAGGGGERVTSPKAALEGLNKVSKVRKEEEEKGEEQEEVEKDRGEERKMEQRWGEDIEHVTIKQWITKPTTSQQQSITLRLSLYQVLPYIARSLY